METERTKWLKKIALQFLKEKGMNAVVNEVPCGKLIADALGLNFKRREIRIVEIKQTLADYKKGKSKISMKSGYYLYAHYFYVMCPRDIIPIDLVDPGIGLIYVNDDDTYEIVKKPFKNTKRLKALFDTTLKNAIHRLSNELYYKDEKEYKDPTEYKYRRNANIFLSAIRCPSCKHVTKELINSQTKTIKCSNCKNEINLENAKIREITGFNKKFIKRIEELKEGD